MSDRQKVSRQAVEVREFLGLVSNRDPSDLEPGQAREQVNLAVINPGELLVRRGYRVVQFED